MREFANTRNHTRAAFHAGRVWPCGRHGVLSADCGVNTAKTGSCGPHIHHLPDADRLPRHGIKPVCQCLLASASWVPSTSIPVPESHRNSTAAISGYREVRGETLVCANAVTSIEFARKSLATNTDRTTGRSPVVLSDADDIRNNISL